MKRSRVIRFVLPAALCALQAGCATHALWEEGRFIKFHEPASPAHLRLFQSPQTHDVLAEYDESCESNDAITPRAYWIGPNQARITAKKKPRFVAHPSESALVPVPMAQSPTNLPAPPSPGLYVAVSTNNSDFALYANGADPRLCELPVYPNSSRRLLQVALTPLTVAADLTIIGGLIGFCCMESWGAEEWRSQNDPHHPR